jgi:hypothetical protein
MAIDANTGLFTWTPTASEVGTFSIVLSVADGQGNSVQQSFSLTVVTSGAPDHPPTITSTPGGPAIVGNSWQYQLIASDPDGDALTYSLTNVPPSGGTGAPTPPPTGMTINAQTGLVTWTASAAGLYPVAITVDEGRGLTATQTFNLGAVVNPTDGPPVFTSTAPTTAIVGAVYQYQAVATSPAGNPITFAFAWQLGSVNSSGSSAGPPGRAPRRLRAE